MYTKGISTNQDVMHGVPCIRNTRFPVSQLIAELLEGHNLKFITDDYSLDYDISKQAIKDVIEILKENTK